MGPLPAGKAAGCYEKIFRGGDSRDILDVRPREQKERLFTYKQEVWESFNYSRSYLNSMKSQSFWDDEFAKIHDIDSALLRARVG